MSLPSQLSSYLDQRGAQFEVCMHEHSHNSAETARTANIAPGQLAKSVILEDDTGCLMAIVPADKAVMVDELARMMGRRTLKLADESRIAMLFKDCERGAIPPLGMAWGVETVVDDDVESSDVIYMEGGDHESLLRMSREQFHALTAGLPHGHFCKPTTH